MRLFEDAAHCDATNGIRELQRSCRNRALTNSHRDRFPGVPFAMEHALYPLFTGYESGFLRWQVYAGAMSKPQVRGIIRNPVNSQPLPHVIKEDVARLYDRFMQIHEAVRGLSVYPTLELPAVKRRVRRTKCRETCGRHLVFEHRGGHDDFEDGARRELRLNRPIQ